MKEIAKVIKKDVPLLDIYKLNFFKKKSTCSNSWNEYNLSENINSCGKLSCALHLHCREKIAYFERIYEVGSKSLPWSR